MDSLSRALLMCSGGQSWQYVGVSSEQTGATINFPSTAQAGDLAVVAGSSGSPGSTPSGWTIIASGSTFQYFKVCAGGESSVTSPESSGHFAVVLFRPRGGTPTLSASSMTQAFGSGGIQPASDLSLTSLPSLAVLIGSALTATWAASLPAGAVTVINRGSSSAFYVAYLILDSGVSTGPIQIYSTITGFRNTFGVFHLT